MVRASPNEKGGKGDGWAPEDPGQWSGSQQGHDRERQFRRRPRSCPGPARGSQLCRHCPIARSAERAKSRTRCRVELGRNPNDTRHPGQRSGRPFPRGERAVPPTLRRQVGPRPARPTHRELRSRSDKPWPRRSLSRRARCAASWARILMRQLLRSRSPDRSYGAARHVPGLCYRSRHVGSVIVSHLPLALRRRRPVPPLPQLAAANASPKRIRQRPTSGRGGKRSNSRCSRIG